MDYLGINYPLFNEQMLADGVPDAPSIGFFTNHLNTAGLKEQGRRKPSLFKKHIRLGYMNVLKNIV